MQDSLGKAGLLCRIMMLNFKDSKGKSWRCSILLQMKAIQIAVIASSLISFSAFLSGYIFSVNIDLILELVEGFLSLICLLFIICLYQSNYFLFTYFVGHTITTHLSITYFYLLIIDYKQFLNMLLVLKFFHLSIYEP